MKPREDHMIGPWGDKMCDLTLVMDRVTSDGKIITEEVDVNEVIVNGSPQRTKENNVRWMDPIRAEKLISENDE